VNTRDFYFGVLAITSFFALILAVYFTIKTRDDIAWSLIPLVISIGIFVWALMVFFHLGPQNTSPK